MSGSQSPSLGEIVRTHRIRAGLSQESLSEASGISVRAISDLERGLRTRPRLETIRMLAAGLELSEPERQWLLEAARPDLSFPIERTEQLSRPSYGASRWAASIPASATELIGRSQEIAQLVSLLDERAGEVVTLTGPGGVGKTRLAVEAAHRLAPTRADGAFFVNLATETGAERVPDAIAKVLGLSLQAASIGDELKRFLSNRDALLILDNFEQVIDAAPFVAELAASCTRLTILVTSRMRLRLSVERELAISALPLGNLDDPLDTLRANDANVLFVTRAQRVVPGLALNDQNAIAITEICRRVEGFALGIELAASRLRLLSVTALLDRLERRLPLLTGGDRDLHPRQQSMRATIAWSYDLLSTAEQRFLCLGSVFVGGLSLDSAEAIGAELGLQPVDALEALTTLVDSGLAYQVRTQDGNPRVHLFETVREFGLEQLEETGERECAHRFHALHFLEFASRDAPRPDELPREVWIGRLAAEHANLIPAFDLLCTPRTVDECLRFAAIMGPYWDYCGPVTEAKTRLLRALALAPAEPTVLELHVRCWTSFMVAVTSDYDGALESAHQSIALANQVGSPGDQAAALQALAMAQEYHEQFDIARQLLEQVMERWESIGNSLMHASCLMYHSGLEYARGNRDRAMHEAEYARLVFADAGEFGWTAACSWYQGMFAMDAGEVAWAAALHALSLRTWLRSDSPWRWFKPLVGLADAGAAAGCYLEASQLLGVADELLAVTGAELMPFDKPGYERAETACRQALGDAEFETNRIAGTLLTPDAWLTEANEIVEAARAIASTSTQ